MTQAALAVPETSADQNIDPQVHAFLKEVNKDPSPFWELPGPQVRATLTGLQDKYPVDMSGVTIADKSIDVRGRTVKLYIMKPEKTQGTLPVILFIHGGVWIAGDFENHKRLVRDLVVGTGAAAVFVEYTLIPDAIYPTQLEEIYAAAKWVVSKGLENGLDGSRMAVAGNSVGGNMSAALAMMAKDRNGPKIALQVLMVPATDANVDTASYHEFASGFFLARAFMKFGWDIYVPAKRTRDMPYVSPLRASLDQLRGLPPALVITAQFDPLRDEGEAYAAKLKQAGVPVVATRYNGTIHDFVALNGVLNDPETLGAIQQACDQLKAHLF
jgi:acetyl esterase/lipase